MEMKSRSCDSECAYLFSCHPVDVFGVDDADEHCSPSLDFVDKFGKGWTGADLCDIAERGAFGRSRSRFVFTLTPIYFGSHICHALFDADADGFPFPRVGWSTPNMSRVHWTIQGQTSSTITASLTRGPSPCLNLRRFVRSNSYSSWTKLTSGCVCR